MHVFRESPGLKKCVKLLKNAIVFCFNFHQKINKNWTWKLENRCVLENSIKNRFLAALVRPRIDFWCIFGSRPGPKIDIFWAPVHLIFQKNFTTSSKEVWIGVRRLRERPRDPPGTSQGPSRGPSRYHFCLFLAIENLSYFSIILSHQSFPFFFNTLFVFYDRRW